MSIYNHDKYYGIANLLLKDSLKIFGEQEYEKAQRLIMNNLHMDIDTVIKNKKFFCHKISKISNDIFILIFYKGEYNEYKKNRETSVNENFPGSFVVIEVSENYENK